MPLFSAKPSTVSPRSDVPAAASPGAYARAVGSTAALLAVAIWMGGLVALGALAAPVVFAVVPMPASADAMTIVFRRFDWVAITCGAVVLAAEAGRAVARSRFLAVDFARLFASLAATGVAVLEGAVVSPRIARLHALGALRGSTSADGALLSRLHDIAETCGKTQLFLLAVVVALHVVTLSSARAPGRR